MAGINLFGWQFEIGKAEENKKDDLVSISPEINDGSSVEIVGEGSHVAGGLNQTHITAFDAHATVENEALLIARYREVSMVPEVDFAIDDIVNAFVSTEERVPLKIDLDEVKDYDKLKDKISEEFDHILKLMRFNTDAYNIIRRWYIDGRLPYQVIIGKDQYRKEGISKLVYLDPIKLKKVRQVKKSKDERTGANVYSDQGVYYIYSDAGFQDNLLTITGDQDNIQGIKLSDEAIAYATSGLLNPTNTVVLSHLHKALRNINQMKAMEDAMIIYRITRAPERRIFYIDVGGLPAGKAEEHLRRQMNQFKSKISYDPATGSIKSDAKVLTMLEDFWLPRRSDGKATEIDTLPGGQNLSDIEDVNYFLNKLYKSLNIPVSRLDSTTGFNIGRVTEISRDEVKFMKFIYRLRREFSKMLLDLLGRQLSLKGIMNREEFEQIREDIHFEYASDNIFEESKMNEIMLSRVDLIQRMEMLIGTFYSKDWIRKNILRLNDDEIKEMQKEMDKDAAEQPSEDEEGGSTNVMHWASRKPGGVTPAQASPQNNNPEVEQENQGNNNDETGQ